MAQSSTEHEGMCPAVKRVKTLHAVAAFDTLSDAMAVEAAAKEHGIPGRMIPVPSEINAGCGMSWAAPLDQREELEAALQVHELAYEGIYEVKLY